MYHLEEAFETTIVAVHSKAYLCMTCCPSEGAAYEALLLAGLTWGQGMLRRLRPGLGQACRLQLSKLSAVAGRSKATHEAALARAPMLDQWGSPLGGTAGRIAVHPWLEWTINQVSGQLCSKRPRAADLIPSLLACLQVVGTVWMQLMMMAGMGTC